MATLTVYSSVDDGYIRSDHATYSTARSGGTLSVQTALGVAAVGQDFDGFGPTYTTYEAFHDFDTSSLTAAATVSAAVLSLYGHTDQTTTDFTMQARLYDWGTGLTTGDWVAGASLSSQTLLATFATSGFTTSGYNDFTSDAAFPGNVNKTGETRLLVCSSRHSGNNTPTGAEWLRVHDADAAGTTNDPKLVVTYTVPVDATATPAAVANTLALPASSPSASFTQTPSAVASVLSTPSATLQAGSQVTPAVVPLVASLPQASPSLPITVTPDVLAALIALPAPSLSAGSTPTPGAIGIILASPQASPSAGVIQSPDVVALITSIEAVTAALSATTNPATVAALIALLQASVSAGVTVSPDVIALMVGSPTPEALGVPSLSMTIRMGAPA